MSNNKSLSEIFGSLEKEWKKILFSAAGNALLKPALKEVIDTVEDLNDIAPPLENIFRAFQLCPFESSKVIILGQDPYPTRGHASGLAFAPEKNSLFLPKSLSTILGAVKNDIKFGGKIDADILYDWAEDGVLLLNTALTTIVGSSLAHEKIWKQYTSYLIEKLAETKNFVWILWGTKAFNYEKDILEKNNNSVILKWGHPSPLNAVNKSDNPKNFSYCNNFSKANEELIAAGFEPISWIPERIKGGENQENKLNKNVLYCGADGACSGNGKATARAAWAYSIYDTANKIGNEDDSKTIDLNNLKKDKIFTAAGLVTGGEDNKNDINNTKDTNQRAELQAINFLLLHILKNKDDFHSKNYDQIMIISDSKYAICSISVWGPRWIQTNKTNKKKNLDIILPAIKNLKEVEAAGFKVIFYHIRGHRPYPAYSTDFDRLAWQLNDCADKAAVVVTSG
jgi:uracil-DNA glycosylase